MTDVQDSTNETEFDELLETFPRISNETELNSQDIGVNIFKSLSDLLNSSYDLKSTLIEEFPNDNNTSVLGMEDKERKVY